MDLQYSLYNFNWMDAPPEMKKLIFMLQLRLTRPNFIEGGPFFIVNLELFGDVRKLKDQIYWAVNFTFVFYRF